MSDSTKSVAPQEGRSRQWIAGGAVLAIAASLLLELFLGSVTIRGSLRLEQLPLLACLLLGGGPLVVELLFKLSKRQFGSDLLAGISIVTSVLLGEYLAGALVVLMLSGGAALEAFAVRRASSALQMLARRMPSLAHRHADGSIVDVPVDQVRIGDLLQIFPHEICPVDGTVQSGNGTMDESYLTGEPYVISKSPGAYVLSGAINGETLLGIRAGKLAIDSRYAKIMNVVQASEQSRPRMRRLGDQLGAIFTPLALLLAGAAWLWSGQASRFLAVLVVATPCPLLIAIPVAIIGSISLAARRGIIVRDPSTLETVSLCRTAIFDKTGTLTYGRPKLIRCDCFSGFDEKQVLQLIASLERYSKHPLAGSILQAARAADVQLLDAQEVSEPPGKGMRGIVAGYSINVTGRKKLAVESPEIASQLPASEGGLECIVLVDEKLAGVLHFRDEPRSEGTSFVQHLWPKHHFDRVLLVSGDRDEEVRWLAGQVGIDEIYSNQSPEQKLTLVQAETRQAPTMFLGDGINDAPALLAATVGIAFGQNSDVTSEAAGAVILDSSLAKVDEYLHIGRRMRVIAMQSAIGGMVLSAAGMLLAALGLLSPVAGALTQEVIDVLAIANSLRVALPPAVLSDFAAPTSPPAARPMRAKTETP